MTSRRTRASRGAAAGPAGVSSPTNRQRDGRITTDAPDELWANDRTEAWTRLDGRCAGFAVVDHCTGEAWVDTAPRMDKWAAARFNEHWLLERNGYRSPHQARAAVTGPQAATT